MNKYILIIIAALVLLGGGMAVKKFGGGKAEDTGVVRELTITAQENKWNWNPDEIEIDQGDTVKITIINEDNYDHGFAIDAYGISQRIPANGTINVEFVATRPGDFPFYCSVPCGEGEVEGEKRGHFDQVGKIRVKSLVTTDGQPSVPADTGIFERQGTWEEVVEALKTGHVKMISQFHDLTVRVTLDNGTVFTAKEPKVDAIFEEIRKCGAACKGII